MSQKSNADNHSNQGNSNNTTPNHNNSAYKGGIDNRSEQLNPNNSKYRGASRGGKK